jgi:electron transport complex protein RnfC
MKLFPVRGGVHPDYRKELTAECAIVPLPLPARLYLPLQQHIGAPAELLVSAGDVVRKGQLLAAAGGAVSAPVHAPASGTIVEIADHIAPHPSGLTQPTIVLAPDGRDEWAELPDPLPDPFAASAREIAKRVADAGIVGLGGATFPSAVKLTLGLEKKLDTLLLNGAECEPYLTCDDRVMREHAAEVVDGARIMAHALGAPNIVVAIEGNKPQAVQAMSEAAAAFTNVTVVAVPVQYPMGSERHLTQAITGRETPVRKLTADLGVVVHNVGTARAVHHAIRFSRPLLSRVVTVSGRAVNLPKNVEVPLGTRVADVIQFCGGLREQPKLLISGGPMMGAPLPALEAPVVKGTCGILALTAAETNEAPPGPCIRCGSCVTICPCGLVPVEMASYIRKDNLDAALRIGVMDCVSCGSCSYVCPSHIPLVQYFNYAKGAINARDREQKRADHIKGLVETKNARVEKLAAKKAATKPAAPAPAPAAPTTEVSA